MKYTSMMVTEIFTILALKYTLKYTSTMDTEKITI